MFSFLPTKADDIPSIWNRFENWLAKNAPHLTGTLNAPASEEDINALEKILGESLPMAYAGFLKIHNGQDRDGEGLIDAEELLRILEEWTVWKELLDKGDFNGTQAAPDAGVKASWWNVKWIPITYDGSGNHYCLDLDPATGGRRGQVIRVWHDSAERELIADSFQEWISGYVRGLERGRYVYSEDWSGIINKDDL
ncbi:SMI1/KNR4 family protein [Roseivirga sp. BDSF3-8]|uniref:SMI1/KNR4 family protein n=1 Tax=Roseivirga sp. BDSF3-8 TaxID=3241598 RepID=UPI0035320AC5